MRELESRWKQSGEYDDYVGWIRGLLRAGQTTHGRLAVAARYGDKAALRVVEEPAADLSVLDDDREASVRVAFAAAKRALQACLTAMYSKNSYVDSSRFAINATRDWLVDPCERTRGEAEERAKTFELDPKGFPPGQEPDFYRVLEACSAAVQCVVLPAVPDMEKHAELVKLLERHSIAPPPPDQFQRYRDRAVEQSILAFERVHQQSTADAEAVVGAGH